MDPAPNTNAPKIQVVRAKLIGLSFECPLGGDPENCHCHELRKLSPPERLRWLGRLSDDECITMYNRHLACLEGQCAKPPVAPSPV